MIRDITYSLLNFLRVDRLLYEIKKRKNYATILCLHRVSDEFDFFWPPLRIDSFKKLINYCCANYEIVHFSDLSQKKSHKPKLVLSFDDGYYDFIQNALPILKSLSLPSNHNVVINCADLKQIIWTQQLNALFSFLKENKYTGKLPLEDKEIKFKGDSTHWTSVYLNVFQTLLAQPALSRHAHISLWRKLLNSKETYVKMMNWVDIMECHKNDVEIGSHTVSHDALPTIKEIDKVNFEINHSKSIIEQKIGSKCKTIALPNGKFSDIIMGTIKRAGYSRVLLANDNFLHMKQIETEEQLLSIPRINVVEESDIHRRFRLEGFIRVIKNGRL